MSSRAAVASALLITIVILVSVFIVIIPSIQLGTFSIGLPKGASLIGQAPISVTGISLSQGGSIQNQYLINTYWDVALSVRGLTNTAFLKFGPGNASASVSLGNGGTATPQSQIYVTIDPGTPYATVALKPINIQWSPAASGWGDPSKGVFCGAVLQFTGCFQYTYHSNPAQTTTFYVPAQQYWTFHYPMTITVQKVGGTNPFTQSQSIDAVSQNSITIGAPNDPDENVTINQLGFDAGGLSQVSVGTPIFFNGGSVCGASNLCGFAGDAQSQIQNYAQYWYGSETTWPSLGYNICNCSTPGQNLGNTQDNPIQTYYPGHPGWKQIETYNNGQTQYTYQPIAPSLTTNTPGLTSNLIYNGYSGSGGIGYGDSEKNSTQAGLSFLNWMYAQAPKEIGGTVDPSLTAYSNPYGNSNLWSVSTQQLTIDLSGSGSLLSSVIIPQTQLLVSTSLADTVVNQVNSAPFTITQIASTTGTLGGGQITNIGVTVQNIGSYAGSATISFSQISDLVNLSPPSATFTLNSGASQTFNFAATGLYTTTPNLDKLTFFVMNSAGLVTDSKSLTLTVEPPPLVGTTDFKIENVSLPKSVAVGAQVSMTVDIQSIGVAGVAYITATSSANQIASVNPTHVNQSMGSGNTVPVGFTVVGVALPSGVTQQSVTIDVQVSNGSSISESMVSILVTSTGGAPCVINCNNNNSSEPALTEIIAIVLVVVAAGTGIVAVMKRKKSPFKIKTKSPFKRRR